jgi:hypothetical protein
LSGIGSLATGPEEEGVISTSQNLAFV